MAGNTEWWSILLFSLGLILLLSKFLSRGLAFSDIRHYFLVIGIIFAAPTPIQGIITLRNSTGCYRHTDSCPISCLEAPGCFAAWFWRSLKRLTRAMSAGSPIPIRVDWDFRGSSYLFAAHRYRSGRWKKSWMPFPDSSYIPAGTRVRLLKHEVPKLLLQHEE